MYGVSLQPDDERPAALVLREVYLDFYSKSLNKMQSKPDTTPFSKLLQDE